MTAMSLTERDLDLLRFLEQHRSAPLELLAQRFFATNPFTGAVNAQPLKACERRLSTLRAHGYIELDRLRIGGRTVATARVATKADAALGTDASRRAVPRNARIHHFKTLEAIAALERSLAIRGGRVLSFALEPKLRADEQRGTKTRRGHDFAPFPDAVCTVAFRRGTGEERYDVAVEYATSKYTSRDIREKHESFARRYRQAFWFADRDGTSKRIRDITGGTCTVLR